MEGIDRCNSSARKKSYFKNCANLFNYLLHEPRWFAYKDLCNDFNVSYELKETEEVKLPAATPDKIKDKMGETHSEASFS